MSPTKHTPSNQSSARDFKHRVLTCLHKLSDRDTHSAAATELESIAKTLTPESIPPFLSSISVTDSSDKSPVRKQCVRLISTLSETHGNLLSPHLSKLESFIVRRLRDHDTAVRAACVAAAGSVAAHVTKPTFVTVIKPFVEAVATEQDLSAQIGTALCMNAVISHSPDPDTVYLRRLLLKIEKLLKSDCFRGKAALLAVVTSVISVGAASSPVIVRNLVKIMTEFVAKSEDWSVRKAAAEVLEKLAVVETDMLTEFKASCLKTFEAKKIDKVKSVRETMSRMIEAWNAIPDLREEVSPPPESHSSKEESNIPNPPRTPTINKRTVPYSGKKTGSAMFSKLDRKKPNDQKLDASEVNIKRRFTKHETRRALFSEISDEKMHESQYHEDRSSSRVEENNGGFNNNSVQQDSEDLSLIRNQLAQIESRQSNLYDLLQKFIGNSMNGMQSLESRVRGLESTLDEISFDFAKSTLNPETTLCCKLPGIWKKPETQHYPSVNNKDLESFNFQTTGFHPRGSRAGFIKNPLADSSNQT